MIRTLGTGLYPVAGDLQADTREEPSEAVQVVLEF
jgi:hypothetical protein